MLTPLAHHLSTAGVSLYRNCTHRAPLDVFSLDLTDPHCQVPHLPALLHQEGPVLRTGQARVPGGGTETAKLLDAGGAGDGYTLGLGSCTNVADRVTSSTGAPRTVGIQRHF